MSETKPTPPPRPTRRAVLRLALGGLAAGVAWAFWPWRSGDAGANPYPISDHFDGETFFNPWRRHKGNIGRFLRWQWEGGRVPWPDTVEVSPSPLPVTLADGQVAMTFIGQSTFLVRTNGLSLLTDPVFSDRAGPYGRIGPRRVRKPGHALEALPPVPVVLLSHNHYDHCDLPTLHRLAERSNPLIVTALGLGRFLQRQGLRNVVELDWWGRTEVPGGRVTFVPAQHFSARGLTDRNQTLWGGFIIEANGATLYFAGDSGYGPHFAAIAERFPRIDAALLPIGAYEPRWFMATVHIEPAEAVKAHLDVRARRSVAMHFGTFQLTNEGIDAPLAALRRALDSHGLPADQFTVPGFGETFVLDL